MARIGSNPLADRLRGWLELLGQADGIAPGTGQVNDLSPELRRIRGTGDRHGRDLLQKHERLNQTGATPTHVVVLTARDLTNEERHRLRGANQVLNKGDTSLRDLAGELHALAAAPRLHAEPLPDTSAKPAPTPVGASR